MWQSCTTPTPSPGSLATQASAAGLWIATSSLHCGVDPETGRSGHPPLASRRPVSCAASAPCL